MTGSLQAGLSGPVPGERPPRLPPRRHKLLLTVHVAAAVSLLGTDLVLLALGISGLRGADPQTVYPAASLIASWLVAPLVVVALGTGALLAVVARWGLLRYWWVTIKLTATVVFTGVVVLVLVPRLAASADAATAARTFTTAERMPLAVVPSLAVAVLILLVGLAIFKPGGQLRSRRGTTPTTGHG
ncbi:MAG: hypothetical protein GEV09_14030 [Pseudonocardiaceae bacterium]|nr:hypothetical protein [Pseudonocardiaceae bacterium]